MALTVEWIRAAEDDELLFELLSGQLQRLLPEEIQENRDLYQETLATLPRGLRAMAGTHFFGLSMSPDDLAWHFGNQSNERDPDETLNGLRESELFEIAHLVKQQWEFMKPHLHALQAGDMGGKEPHDWLGQIGAQRMADPTNKIIWDHCEQAGKPGLLASWTPYASKYPERCVVAESEV